MYTSTKERIKKIKEEVAKRYEKGNQAKSKAAIYRNYIKREFGISYRTYVSYLNTPTE